MTASVNSDNETWNQMFEYLICFLILYFCPRCCEELLKFSENLRAFHLRDLFAKTSAQQGLIPCNLCNIKRKEKKKKKTLELFGVI